MNLVVVLPLVFLFSLVVAGVGPLTIGRGEVRSLMWLHGSVFVLLGVDLMFFLLSEDDYRAGGTSTWAAHDGHLVAVGAIAAALAVALVSGLGAWRRRRIGVVAAGLLGAAACAVLALAFMMFAGDN